VYARNTGSVLLRVGKDIYISRERGREDVSINTGNIEALALSGDMYEAQNISLQYHIIFSDITGKCYVQGLWLPNSMGLTAILCDHCSNLKIQKLTITSSLHPPPKNCPSKPNLYG
jgi:hypothetical protein